MSDILPKPLNEEELKAGRPTDLGIKIQISAEESRKEVRLDALRTLLKSRREREGTMRKIENVESSSENFGQSLIGSGNVKQEDYGESVVQPDPLRPGKARLKRPAELASAGENHQSTLDNRRKNSKPLSEIVPDGLRRALPDQVRENADYAHPVEDTARHLSALPVENLNSLSPTSDPIVSESMSLLDESMSHIFGLMKGLHSNQPAAEVKGYDPDRVNSAVSCANTIYKMMRLKLDAIKVQRKLVK